MQLDLYCLGQVLNVLRHLEKSSMIILFTQIDV